MRARANTGKSTKGETPGSHRLAIKYRLTPPSDDTRAKLEQGNYRRIARGSGLSPQHVARVVTGRKGASLHVGKRIAEAAGVSLDELYAYILFSPGLKVRGRRTLADVAQTEMKKVTDKIVRVQRANSHTTRKRPAPRVPPVDIDLDQPSLADCYVEPSVVTL